MAAMDQTITSIEPIALRIPLDIWAPPPMSQGTPRTHVEGLYVRVTTGGGVVGWGECFGTARPMVLAAFDSWIRRLAVGQSASDEQLIPRIERMLLSLSRSGPLAHALAGLDIALWDIRGKLAGVSVSTLLGGAKRKCVECYASLLQYSGNAEYIKRNTARALERGYRYIKLHEKTAPAVAAAREEIGPDIPLMVDTNCAWTPAEAEAAVTAMAPYKPYWVEEPIYPPEDFESLARLRTSTGVPMGIGENSTSLREFRRMVTVGKADFIQPAMVKLGITHMAQVAAEVEQAGAILVPNAFYIGPAFLAALHCMAAKEKNSPLERMFADFGATPFAKTVPVINGGVEVPEGPGLGADPEDELIARFRV
ncbi:MAG: mandelate racemase/muconate lactonizing enzyme family protein [Deltaproteobacteria bacterium]|nr:mandelate racemase/muconate lactonizing enzyme family protein [Deltaproteobacteria bacterium]